MLRCSSDLRPLVRSYGLNTTAATDKERMGGIWGSTADDNEAVSASEGE